MEPIDELREALTDKPAGQPQKFEQWAILELFGKQRIAGLVSEETIGGCSFVRVDVPKTTEEGWAFTKLFGNGAIYAITITTKERVLKAVELLCPKPYTPRVSEDRMISSSYGDDDDQY